MEKKFDEFNLEENNTLIINESKISNTLNQYFVNMDEH